jgi:hypothetical protein
MTGHRIIKNLTKRGNSVLGVGVYSAALAASNGVDAIKIGTNMDDPWLDFKALVVDKLQSNTHLPSIKSFYIDNSSEFFVCVMEKLDSVQPATDATKLIDYCKEYVEGYHSDDDLVGYAENYNQLVPNTKELLEVLKLIKTYTTHFNHSSYSDDEDYEPTYDGRKLDMHSGNFMLRDGVLVVTDPWCNVSMDSVQDLSLWAEEQISSNSKTYSY